MMATSTMSIRWIVIWARLATARGPVKRQNPRDGRVAHPGTDADRVPGPRYRPVAPAPFGLALTPLVPGSPAAPAPGRWSRRIRRSQYQPTAAAGT